MIKQEFLKEMKPRLKALGYRKNGNYWYQTTDRHICCIHVQGSQWSKDAYYVEVGFAFPAENNKMPTLLHWHCRHRCIGANGDKNPTPDEVFAEMEKIFGVVSLTDQIDAFLIQHAAKKVAAQFFF